VLLQVVFIFVFTLESWEVQSVSTFIKAKLKVQILTREQMALLSFIEKCILELILLWIYREMNSDLIVLEDKLNQM